MILNIMAVAAGIWRAVLTLPDGELPFNFDLKQKGNIYSMEIKNAEEKIIVTEIILQGDSFFARLPVYDSEIRARVNESSMIGVWINHSRKNNQSIPFAAQHGKAYRFFEHPENSRVNISGKWETWFNAGTKDSSLAIGLFKQTNAMVTGTFLTSTGDYRYLEGAILNDSLFLSCFDGANAYLFKARISENTIDGILLSGNHWKTNFICTKNEKIELPNPDSLTFLKKGYNKFDFGFPDTDSNMIRLSDKKFQNKVIIVQIMGSWCPNCLDETVFLSDFYSKNQAQGIEIIAIAFEKTNDFKKAAANIKRVQNRTHAAYSFVLAGNRENANTALPMLNRLMGYPTTIFIDKKGNVRKIYTGFTGPATGMYFENYKKDFEKFIAQLASE